MSDKRLLITKIANKKTAVNDKMFFSLEKYLRKVFPQVELRLLLYAVIQAPCPRVLIQQLKLSNY